MDLKCKHCGGRLFLEPDEYLPDLELKCINCGRPALSPSEGLEAAGIRYRLPSVDVPGPKQGRKTKVVERKMLPPTFRRWTP
jgi:DNA-directed RNA polymerase subunit RPC12/RpoP